MSKVECTDCGSSDGCEVYDDGHTYCFVCNKYRDSDGGGAKTVGTAHIKAEHLSKGGDWVDGERMIPADVGKHYGCSMEHGKHIYPYYSGNAKTANKVRNVADKEFYSEGDLKSCGLFGQHLFSSGGKRLVVCEGELDAMSAYELMDRKFACVSLKTGAASAVKEFKENLEYIESFDAVFIAFDMDKAGRAAADKVAPLLSPNKARIMNMAYGKDANEYLSTGKRTEFQVEFWRSPTYRPDGIISGEELWDSLSTPVEASDVLYPWDGLNAMTYGIRTPQLITLAAGSGLGKSTILRKLQHHMLKTTTANIGCMMLEESTRDTGLGIMSVELEKPLHLPSTEYTPTEFKEAYDTTLGSGRVFLYDSFGSNDIDNIVSRVRYFAKAMDCKYIFLDHISIIVSAQENTDERKALDEIMTKLRMLVQEVNIALFVVSHLKRPMGKGHEEGAITSLGQLRGSAAIGQLSDIVIGGERDGQHENEDTRNTTLVRVLKNRFSGLTGPACHLHYDKDTGCLTEVEFEESEF